MVSQLTEWLKFIVVSTTIASGVFSVGVSVAERYSAVPVLQRDVKNLKRDMKYVVKGMAKLTKTTPPLREINEDDE